ncbi:hypothetical protein [Pseudomonas sp. Q1-7]|uniref:hypothetical protein n=1 Tax=Pseudomonas sp. Q1-7 TaxID=3020843 RepID=UPI002301D3CE|nr:hypothetical protein [Pseudomonas sp. Q1-7]
MNLRNLIIAAITAALAIGGVAITYISSFGTTRSPDPAIWGQFGDYFGGILNPTFALAAFLSALWSISVQQREARLAARQLSEQTEIARREFESLISDRVGDELLHVTRDIDQRLSSLLQTVISPPGAPQVVTIAQMAAEAERFATVGGSPGAFQEFVRIGNTPGTVVEASVREIKYLISRLRSFLEHYSRLRGGSFAPVLIYYSDKAYQLIYMLEALGDIPDDTREFFATVSDAHS